MRKQLYLAIIAQLSLIRIDSDGNYYTDTLTPPAEGSEDVPVDLVAITHFDVWNNNIKYIADELPFSLPAVFIQFQPIQWEARSKGVRAADVSFTLHVITRHNAAHYSDSLEFLDLLSAINAALYNLKGDFFRNMVSTTSTTDHDHDDLIDSMETYTVQLTDTTAVRTQILAPAPTPVVAATLG